MKHVTVAYSVCLCVCLRPLCLNPSKLFLYVSLVKNALCVDARYAITMRVLLCAKRCVHAKIRNSVSGI